MPTLNDFLTRKLFFYSIFFTSKHMYVFKIYKRPTPYSSKEKRSKTRNLKIYRDLDRFFRYTKYVRECAYLKSFIDFFLFFVIEFSAGTGNTLKKKTECKRNTHNSHMTHLLQMN